LHHENSSETTSPKASTQQQVAGLCAIAAFPLRTTASALAWHEGLTSNTREDTACVSMLTLGSLARFNSFRAVNTATGLSPPMSATRRSKTKHLRFLDRNTAAFLHSVRGSVNFG